MWSYSAVGLAALLFASDMNCLPTANATAMYVSAYQQPVKPPIPIVGDWVAHDSASVITHKKQDGTTSAIGVPLVVTLSLMANGRATIKWGVDKPSISCIYRLLSKDVIEFSSPNSKQKPGRYTYYQVKDRLEFGPYPSKNLQESISLLCALTFIRK